MPDDTPPPPSYSAVAGIVLAAGRSARFGGDHPKQLLDFHGEPMVRRTARGALGSRLGRVVVVVGYRGEEVAEAVTGLGLEVVENPAWETGIASSVAAGLAAARAGGDPPAVMIVPADQPLLGSAELDLLLSAWEETRATIVHPVFGDRRGAPTLFARSLFGELAKLKGDCGGRRLIHRRPELAHSIELASEGPLLDVDTRERYEQLLREKG